MERPSADKKRKGLGEGKEQTRWDDKMYRQLGRQKDKLSPAAQIPHNIQAPATVSVATGNPETEPASWGLSEIFTHRNGERQ